MNTTDANGVLTVAEVAELLKCRVETIRRWIIAGKLPAATLPGGEYRIREDDVQALLTPRTPEGS